MSYFNLQARSVLDAAHLCARTSSFAAVKITVTYPTFVRPYFGAGELRVKLRRSGSGTVTYEAPRIGCTSRGGNFDFRGFAFDPAQDREDRELAYEGHICKSNNKKQRQRTCRIEGEFLSARRINNYRHLRDRSSAWRRLAGNFRATT